MKNSFFQIVQQLGNLEIHYVWYENGKRISGKKTLSLDKDALPEDILAGIQAAVNPFIIKEGIEK